LIVYSSILMVISVMVLNKVKDNFLFRLGLFKFITGVNIIIIAMSNIVTKCDVISSIVLISAGLVEISLGYFKG